MVISKRKILIHFSAWIAFFSGLAVTLAFSHSETANIICHNISVHVPGNQAVHVGSSEIVELAKASGIDIVGARLRDINTHIIEKEVEKHSAVLKAHAYKTIVRDSLDYRGVLAIRVTHRTPVMRVISNNASFYIDDEGVRFPTSTRYAANVLLVTGNITEDLARNKILPLALYIVSDSFWEAQIKQIHVDRNHELLFTPLVGNHIIEFGTVDNYPEKLRNLMAFYEQVLTKNNWNRYHRISLKYNNQIVAKINN